MYYCTKLYTRGGLYVLLSVMSYDELGHVEDYYTTQSPSLTGDNNILIDTS